MPRLSFHKRRLRPTLIQLISFSLWYSFFHLKLKFSLNTNALIIVSFTVWAAKDLGRWAKPAAAGSSDWPQTDQHDDGDCENSLCVLHYWRGKHVSSPATPLFMTMTFVLSHQMLKSVREEENYKVVLTGIIKEQKWAVTTGFHSVFSCVYETAGESAADGSFLTLCFKGLESRQFREFWGVRCEKLVISWSWEQVE